MQDSTIWHRHDGSPVSIRFDTSGDGPTIIAVCNGQGEPVDLTDDEHDCATLDLAAEWGLASTREIAARFGFKTSEVVR